MLTPPALCLPIRLARCYELLSSALWISYLARSPCAVIHEDPAWFFACSH